MVLASRLCEHQRLVQSIGISAADLRHRVDAIIEALQGHSAPQGARERSAVSAEIHEATREAKRLIARLKPLAGMAMEFKLKWEKQKVRLLAQREADIECHLRQKSEAEWLRSETATEEQLAALHMSSEQRASIAAAQVSRDHESELQKAVATWREQVPGAELVRSGDVQKTVRNAVARIGTWAGEQEHRLVQSWARELSQVVTSIHNLDEEVMLAVEDTQMARRAVLQGALLKQRREYAAMRSDQQIEVNNEAQALLSSLSKSLAKQVASQRSQKDTAHARTVRNRLLRAKSEAEAAVDEHVKFAVDEFESFAADAMARRVSFQKAIADATPTLKQQLDSLLTDLAASAKREADANKAKRAKRSTLGSDSRSSISPRQATPRRALTRGVSLVMRPSSATHYRQIDQGSLYKGGGGGRAGTADTEDSDNDSSDDASKKEKENQISALKDKVDVLKAALANGIWKGCIKEAATTGVESKHKTREALQRQESELAGDEAMHKDAAALNRARSHLARDAEMNTEALRQEFVRIRNAKVGLSRKRAERLRELTQQFNTSALEAENNILPAVTKLAHEVEALTEIGYALERGAQRLPVGAVAGAWRRTVSTSLDVLQRLWKAARVSEEQQWMHVDQLLALLEKHPASATIVDEVPGTSGLHWSREPTL